MNNFPSCRKALLSVFASLVGLTGCGRHETPVALGDRTQTLQLGNLSEPNDLDPAFLDSQQTFNIVMALIEGLCQYDAKTGLPVPAVAERWAVAADNLTWTFHLRPNARWSNGDPVTAGDFVYSFKRGLSPKLGAEYAYMLYALRNGEEYYQGKIADFSQVGAEAVDDHTLVLHLSHPLPYLPQLVCHSIWYPIHQATIEKFGKIDDRGTRWTRPGNYVGNGPFVLTEWAPQQIVRVTKSPTYWNREQVRLNGINFYPIENNNTEEAMFRTGQLHITSTMPIEKIPVYRNNPKLRVFNSQTPMLATYYFQFNTAKPPLDNVHVRRALAFAINREEIVERVSLGGQLPAHNLTPPDTGGFTATARIPSDARRARQELAEAGYPEGKGFPRLELLYNTSEGHRKIAEALQQMWRKVLGIDVTLTNQEAKVQIENMHQGSFQIGRFSWIGDYLDPSTFLDIMTSSSGNNDTRWKNAEYDRLIAEAGLTVDTATRYKLYQRCEEILADECPFAPLYFYTRNNLRLPSVKGWYDNLVDLHPYTGVYLDPTGSPTPE